MKYSDYFVAVKRQGTVSEKSMIIPNTVPALTPFMNAASVPSTRKEVRFAINSVTNWDDE